MLLLPKKLASNEDDAFAYDYKKCKEWITTLAYSNITGNHKLQLSENRKTHERLKKLNIDLPTPYGIEIKDTHEWIVKFSHLDSRMSLYILHDTAS